MSRKVFISEPNGRIVDAHDSAHSLTVRRRLWAPDTLIVTTSGRELSEDLDEGWFLTILGGLHGPAKRYVVEQIERNMADESRTTDEWKITARSVDTMGDQRLVLPPEGQSHDEQRGVPAETALKHYVDTQMGPSAAPARQTPNLTIAADQGRGPTVTASGRFMLVSDLLQKIGKKAGVGYEIEFDLATQGNIFETIHGQDLSSKVFFDVAFNSVVGQSWLRSAMDEKTWALVAGQGEGAAREILSVWHDETGATQSLSGYTSSYKQDTLDANPVAYWRLGDPEGSTAATDEMGTDGSYSTAAVLEQPGALDSDPNTAVTRDSGGIILTTPHEARFDLPNTLSIECWLKIPSGALAGSGYAYHPLRHSAGTDNANYVLYFFGEDSGSPGKLAVYATAGGTWQAITTAVTVPDDGEWHYVAFSYDDVDGGAAYLDGSLSGTNAAVGSLASPTGDPDSSIHAGTYLDELALYGRVLTASEIQAKWENATNDTPMGFERRESFVDARDVEPGDTSILVSRGDDALAAEGEQDSFDLDVATVGPFKYRDDFDLGDVVTVRNQRWGLQKQARIVETEVVYTTEDVRVIVQIGRPWPTLQSRIAASAAGSGNVSVDYPTGVHDHDSEYAALGHTHDHSHEDGWSSLSLTSGWANLGGEWETAQIKRIGSMRYLRGLVKQTDSSYNNIVYLTSTDRPPNSLLFTAEVSGAGESARLEYRAGTDPQYIKYRSGGTPSNHLSLTGIHWSVEA